LGGLAQRMPFVAVMFIIASMALIAVPGLANFSGEVLIFFGAFQKYPWLAGIIIWGGVMSAVFQLRAVRAVFFGPCEEKYASVGDVKGWAEKWPYLFLGAALLLLGCYPDLLLKVVEPSVRRLLGG
jgi:NADH-quinone oxidoreductase subunit M